MPKRVDVEQRRTELAEACWRVIVEEGIAGTTSRAVAREARVSSSVLFHYFHSMDELMLFAMELLENRFRDHLRELLSRSSDSVDRLRALGYSNLPLDQSRRIQFGVWLSLWAHSYSSDSVRTRYQVLYRGFREAVANVVDDARGDGLVRDEVDPELAALQIVGLTDGLVVQLIMNPDEPAIARQSVSAVDKLVESWTAPASIRAPTNRRMSASEKED